MESQSFKEDFDSLHFQNVDSLTNNIKMVCPMLDNTENGVNVVDLNSDERDQSLSQDTNNENSLDKTPRRPVEIWKYTPFTTDCNRTSYKCSICNSVYQHKKSLNKHWKDKHPKNPPSERSTMPFQEILPSNIIVEKSLQYENSPSNQNLLSVKREASVSQITTATTEVFLPCNIIDRKRMSLNMDEFDENKENNPLIIQQKRMSLVPMHSLPVFNQLPRVPFPGSSFPKMIDSRHGNNEALDLRTSNLYNNFQINFRCFQCVFHTNNIVQLNEHFKHFHLSILLNVKSFCLPISVYQKLLMNQFTAIVRTESEPLRNFNGPIRCCLCGCHLPTRYDMIQHLDASHITETIWVCLVCGFGCLLPNQLAQHFRCHADIKLLAKSVFVSVDSYGNNSNLSVEFSSPTRPEGCLATSTPKNKIKIIQPSKDQSSVDGYSVKEKMLKCLVCDATARWRSELFTHMITHSEHRSFGCKFCSYRSKWKWDVPKHLKRCRMAPPTVRRPDVHNSYLITLLQYYSPPTGDILHEFMQQYNIKDLGSFNQQIDVKVENEEPSEPQDQSSLLIPYKQEDSVDKCGDKIASKIKKYDIISIVSEDDGDLDVGMDHIFTENTNKCLSPLKSWFKKCPWCQDFLTKNPLEMSSHLLEHHPDDCDSG